MRLTSRLLLITAGCALGAFVATMAAALVMEHRRAALEFERGADTAARVLANAFVGLAPGMVLDTRFPDWDALTTLSRPDGSCARLTHPDGRAWRSDCRGTPSSAERVPDWFQRAYVALIAPAQRVERPIRHATQTLAMLTYQRDGQAEIQRAWQETRRLANLTTALLACLCLALMVSVSRALRPLGDIVTLLEGLARGEHHLRLGRLRVGEFDRIARAGDSLAATLAAHAQERERFSLRLLEAQDAERRQIARDLHDEFGQHLTALAATTATVARLGRGHAALTDPLARAHASIERLQALVRDLLGRLRPPGLDELGLAAAIGALINDWNRRCAGRPRISGECDPACDALPRALAVEIFRVVQECTTNAVRHAEADTITVTLRVDALGCTLEVRDDGRGTEGREQSGHGLANLHERAAACAGRLEFLHPATGGFGVRLSLPPRVLDQP